MSLDDLLFYLPAFGSLAIVGISVTLTWLAWRLIAAWRKKRRPPYGGT
jgi:hypothetical protein